MNIRTIPILGSAKIPEDISMSFSKVTQSSSPWLVAQYQLQRMKSFL